MGCGVLAGVNKKDKTLEVTFIVAFSALVFAIFYSLLGANGLVLGNDPAVHLQTAEYFLSISKIPLSDVAWYTPLYQLVLDAFLAFTGVTSVEQKLILMKAFTALVDWLLIFSVYIVAAKFLGKKTGVLAALLMLLCFPLFELNSWGGYTSILSIAFMTLLLMYLALPLKSIGNTMVAFIFGFSMVLSHQLATFLAVFIFPPFILVVLVKSKGHASKALLAAVLGGAIAFLIYYVKPILPFLNDAISILLFQLTAMLYQVPSVSFNAFMVNFGFVFFFAFAGLIVAFFELRKRKSLGFYLLLVLAFAVPLFFSQSYLVGVYLPYQRFIYFLLPPLVFFASVSLSFVIDASLAGLSNNRTSWKRNFLKAVSVIIIFVLVVVVVARFDTVSGKIGEDTKFYSTSDVNAFQLGTWINQNFPDPSAAGVVTQNPGHWFAVYSDKTVFAETEPIVDWNVNSECVLDMSYELVNPLTMVRVFEAKSGVFDDSYGQMDMVWKRIAYTPMDNNYFSYSDGNGTSHSFELSSLNRSISMDEVHNPKTVSVRYSGSDFVLTEIIAVQNDTYPITVTWQVSALNGDLNYAHLYLKENLDPTWAFTKANVPGLLEWANPWDNATKIDAGNWAITSFSSQNFKEDNCVDIYDASNRIAFALKFLDLPASGNVGALAIGNIDAVRWQYDFYRVSANYTVSVAYQMLSISLTSYPQLKDPHEMNTLFYMKTTAFDVKARNFASIIRDNHVAFIVYDATRFDKKTLNSGWIQLVYSNEEYVVLKIKINHPYPNIFEISG
jgi:hypothetical protein